MITIQTLVMVVVQLLIGGLIVGLLWWLIDYCQVPEPFAKAARVALAVLSVLWIICVLLALVGRPVVVF